MRQLPETWESQILESRVFDRAQGCFCQSICGDRISYVMCDVLSTWIDLTDSTSPKVEVEVEVEVKFGKFDQYTLFVAWAC